MLAACAAAGCDHSSSDDADNGARPVLAAFNAVPDLQDVTFLREEEVWSSIAYGVGTDFRSVDADQYDVKFDSRLPGDETTSCSGDLDRDGVKDTNECTRLVSQSINVLKDHEYVVALVGRYGAASIKVYDDAVHTFDSRTDDGDGADLNAQVQFFNWSAQLGTFDVYLEPPGTNLSATQVKAALAPGNEYLGFADEGSYVLTLSAVANPNAPIYTSETFKIDKRTRVALAILDGTSDSTSAVKVARFRDQGGDLFDRRVKTLMRVAHVAPDAGNLDVFAEEDYTAPLFANLTLKQSTPYIEIPPTVGSELELDITPAGNVGVLLTREQASLTKGERATFFLVKSSNGGVDGFKASDTARRLAPYAQLRLVSSVTQSLDFYVIPHGNNVFTSGVTQTLSSASVGSSQTFEPGTYDVVIARAGTDTFVFGPREVQMAADGIYTVVAVPTVQTTRADVLLLDDFTL
ncbi:MAG TPA: DUF4397 domain-containing protein [Gammaproteobacteria bacterium]|nr:DUF4397 domain-containing protein [Gammaproteobacteria bacterium]